MHASTSQTTLKLPICQIFMVPEYFKKQSIFRLHCQHPTEGESRVRAHLTDYEGPHIEETLQKLQVGIQLLQSLATRPDRGAISTTSATPLGGRTHTPNSPVRAPPRLPLLSCLPSSLSCLLYLKDLPGPDKTSGLLDFRKGIGGGDSM